MKETVITEELFTKLEDSIIDHKLTIDILQKFNKGDYDHFKPVIVKGFPPVDNQSIIDKTKEISFNITKGELKKKLLKYRISETFSFPDDSKNVTINLTSKQLQKIGKSLMPLYSFGILNGGSATSYTDKKKNRSFNPELFDLLRDSFDVLAIASAGRAKGITPAFLNPDGTAGPSFIELKMRALLINNCSSLFQMTSFFNDESIRETYTKYKQSPYLKELIEKKGIAICDVKTGVQPLLAAFTHSSLGKSKNLFVTDDGFLLPLPGGHGQCFITLKKVFYELYEEGIRFISIGNVDNTGYIPDPVSLAILALSGKQAGFDFSYKTPVDVKGGILVKDDRNRLNCVDLGVAIDENSVKEAESNGSSILFNCATGLFNLEYLVENIDKIINSLPMRFSDQDKDAGKYSQAEQVTWEIIGLLDNIVIFAIDKFERFLASKTIMENLMTSGIKLNHPLYPSRENTIAVKLNNGLETILKTIYGLKLENGQWKPKTVKELEKKL
ncbi:MAG: UTP--glucose-1-phosphate uridylyltransferase [Spirochaetaceae bacterium]|nr:UTP--glucose-1-phosphate uridylyltransferase [Spirochaetaceae bacterium]